MLLITFRIVLLRDPIPVANTPVPSVFCTAVAWLEGKAPTMAKLSPVEDAVVAVEAESVEPILISLVPLFSWPNWR